MPLLLGDALGPAPWLVLVTLTWQKASGQSLSQEYSHLGNLQVHSIIILKCGTLLKVSVFPPSTRAFFGSSWLIAADRRKFLGPRACRGWDRASAAAASAPRFFPAARHLPSAATACSVESHSAPGTPERSLPPPRSSWAGADYSACGHRQMVPLCSSPAFPLNC